MLFAGGVSATSTAAQLVPVVPVAPEIDLGVASASLSGLLGGYRSDKDRGILRATFLGPAGETLAAVELASPAAADRANATTLLPRARTDAVPPLTRAIVVTLEARRGDGTGTYNDAYFDNVGLTVAAPGAPAPAGPAAKPFAGVRVLSGRVRLDRRGRVAVRVACADATVGRCTGVVTLAGALRRRHAARPLARRRVDVRAGHARSVRLKLERGARLAVRRRGRIRMTLYTAVRDGQSLTRVSTVPVTVRPRKRR